MTISLCFTNTWQTRIVSLVVRFCSHQSFRILDYMQNFDACGFPCKGSIGRHDLFLTKA